MTPLIIQDEKGLYCPAGDFYVDPWRPVERAVITHAHGDHAYSGHQAYFCTRLSSPIIQQRLGKLERLKALEYGEPIEFGPVRVSLHPAGHILGSAQVRIESKDGVWVVSGDYKRTFDPSCNPFEVVPCDTLITETTFGLPIYKWQPGEKVAQDILAWWETNRLAGKACVLFCYALGKAQRILAELAKLTDRPVYLHGAIASLIPPYEAAGIRMLPTIPVSEMDKNHSYAGELILAPPSAFKSPWLRRFDPYETGFASGWMRVRGAKRRRGYDRGFVLSDHADWSELLQTIEETGAHRVYATHGNSDTLVRYLNERGLEASALKTQYEGEQEE